jgi:hypothetical protein
VQAQRTSLDTLAELFRDNTSLILILAATAVGATVGAAVVGKQACGSGALIAGCAALAAIAVNEAEKSPEKSQRAADVLRVAATVAVGGQAFKRATPSSSASPRRGSKTSDARGRRSTKARRKKDD